MTKTHLDDHTDADAETNARAKVAIRNILTGRGYGDRLTQADLTDAVNTRLPEGAAVSKSTVRSLVRRVRAEYNVAIYSRGSGYYHIQNNDQLDDALGRIDEAIATKEETKAELAEAFSGPTRAPAADGGPPHDPQTSVGHAKRDATDTYIGRGDDAVAMGDVPIGERGWLGNPYPESEYGREECIERFREDFRARLERDDDFAAAVEALHGDTLGCWCRGVDEEAPACHGDVIAEWADRLGGGEVVPIDAAADGGTATDADVSAVDIRREIAAVADEGNTRETVEAHVARALGVAESDVAEQLNRMESNGFIYVVGDEVLTP